MTADKKILVLFFLLIVAILFLFFFWNEGEESRTGFVPGDETMNSEMEEGRILSKQYCASCHTYPEPDLLPQRTWMSQTLPHMGPFLGIFQHNGTEYPVDRSPALPSYVYPTEPQLSNEDWQKIKDYYISEAPETFQSPERNREIIRDSLFFEAVTPDYHTGEPPLVSAVRFDSDLQLIYLSSANDARFLVFDHDLNIASVVENIPALSDIRYHPNRRDNQSRELLLTEIGDISPSDAREGKVRTGIYDPVNHSGNFDSLVVDQIARPVESKWVDILQDGNDELLISEFGHRDGSLFWLKNTGLGFDQEKKVLIDTPGCIQTEIVDYTGNGYPDIFSLCTQVDQAIYFFENIGEGNFEKEKIHQFDITAGSSSFGLYDFNDNGHLDLLYTSGDNADYSQIYKPYHGVYIFLNDGNNNFEEEWFYPVNGAYNAQISDFNNNGHKDIAVISFFADYANQPQESFIIFMNDGNLSFTPYHHPMGTAGRWATMDVADWTGNGYDDIVLANFSIGPTRVHEHIQNIWTQGPYFVLLKNRFDQ